MQVITHLERALRSLLRDLDRRMLPLRFLLRRQRQKLQGNSTVDTLVESIPVQFINLASRPDRLAETQDELKKMGIPAWSRFEAIKHDDGAVGCALSHARVLESFDDQVCPVMVCEDDIEFLVSPDELRALLGEFLRNPAIDVLCVAFNLGSKPHPISPRLAITSNTQTLACYVVKKGALKALQESFLQSAALIQQKKPIGLVAADQHWKRLQRRGLIFAVPRVRAARQRPSFSDIEGQDVSYGL